MAERRKRKPQPFPMRVANDPALWRYESLEAALTENLDVLAQLIRAGKEHEAAPTPEVPEEVPQESPDIARGA
jgi:hypothetical protein